MSDEPIRILIVEARFYDDLADALLEGATQALSAFGAEYDVVTVPGALEIPGAIAFAEEAGSATNWADISSPATWTAWAR